MLAIRSELMVTGAGEASNGEVKLNRFRIGWDTSAGIGGVIGGGELHNELMQLGGVLQIGEVEQ